MATSGSPPLNILYQDKWLIAVDKPAGQLVIPSDDPQPEDQITMKILRDQIGKKLHPLHRLDRPTSGTLLFAHDLTAARDLHAAFKNQEVSKTYWAVVSGHPKKEQFTCHEPIRKSENSPKKPAETSFRLLKQLKDGLSLIEAVPKTGRFHQIRRHLVHLGYPIVGDYRYAGMEKSDRLGIFLGTGTRMLLQSISLQFSHPITRSSVLIKSPLCPLIQKLTERKN